MGLRNFPGVYTTIKDNSFFTSTNSRFRVGLIGPAQKGPINVATSIRSTRDFHRVFGKSLPGIYLANAVQLVSDLSDGVVVVRVARQYEILETSGASATATKGAYTVSTPNVDKFTVGDYARVSQIGKTTTVNARVTEVGATTITLDTAVQDDYTAANIDRSRISSLDGDPTKAVNAANEAEAFLKYALFSATALIGAGGDITVSGTKSSFEVTVETNEDGVFGNSPVIAVGDTVKLKESTGGSEDVPETRELRVKELVPPVPGVKGKIKFEPVNRVDVGYTAVSLQSSYTAAKIYKLSSYTLGYHMLAANPGTWANSDGVRTGLIVKIVPGTKPDSKKIQVYENSSLVEEIDNCSHLVTVADEDGNDVANPDFIVTKVNGKSSYIKFGLATFDDPASCWLGAGDVVPPANTLDGWKSTVTTVNIAAFKGGYNGENVIDDDYIGTVDPVTELPTGLKIFEDRDANLRLEGICAPGVTSLNVAMEMARINRSMKMFGLLDSPNVTPRVAQDWSNGVGLYTDNGKMDDYTIVEMFNWFTMVDSFTGDRVVVPPSCGQLRALAFTYDAFKPNYAAAGETRGVLPEALAVQHPRIPEDVKQAFMGDGNCLNPIILSRGSIMVWGNRTTQRRDSKLTSFSNVRLVHAIARALEDKLRKYVWDPIDDILYNQVYQDAKYVLDGFVHDRGIEQDYRLVVDKTNNTADDRNQRQVILDVDVIPIDALEKLFINLSARESGVVLNSVK